MNRSRCQSWWAVTALALVLTACTGASPQGEAADATATPGAADSVTSAGADETADGAGAPAIEEENPSRLAQYFNDAAGDEEAVRAEAQRVEEAIAGCMRAQGFDYVPYVDPGRFAPPPAVDDLGEGLSPVDFAREYGYGRFTERAAEADAAFLEQAAEAQVADPNAPILAALSPEDQEAYRRTLFGDQQFGGDGTGCYGEADDAVTSAADAAGTELVVAAGAELQERVYADPRMVEATAAWSACMAQRGQRFAAPEDIVAWLDGEGQAFAEQFQMEDSTGSQEDQDARQAELAESEIAIAVADAECQAEQNLDALFFEIYADLEDSFIAENPELSALLGQAGEQDGG